MSNVAASEIVNPNAVGSFSSASSSQQSNKPPPLDLDVSDDIDDKVAEMKAKKNALKASKDKEKERRKAKFKKVLGKDASEQGDKANKYQAVEEKTLNASQFFTRKDKDRANKKFNERLSFLYPDSKKAYKEGISIIENLTSKSAKVDGNQILAKISVLPLNLEERHNLLEVVRITLSDELAVLEGGTIKGVAADGGKYTEETQGKLKEIEKDISALKNKEDQASVNKRNTLIKLMDACKVAISIRRARLNSILDAITILMRENGERIKGGYVLSPAVKAAANTAAALSQSAREVHKAAQIKTVCLNTGPKDLSSTILDSILPLKGDLLRILSVLEDGIFKLYNASKGDSKSPARKNAKAFREAIAIIKKKLSEEMSNREAIELFADARNVAMAIWESIRIVGEVNSACLDNFNLLSATDNVCN